MKRKEFIEYKTKSVEELQHELRERSLALRALKRDIMTGKVKSLKEMRQLQKTIAQLLTLITEKQTLSV